ncbi:SDR family NAD(P)-dependent oxidoreductase [Mesorhizobium sp. M0130]|uniref:SDR family NAD(P)-dependent oxidoreductase n=1 Tax=Mesorhizobium sp. M0130 TaxID=2956887 RepID=UPI0033372F51
MYDRTIVNVDSIEGLVSNPKHAAYCTSKAGIHGLTRGRSTVAPKASVATQLRRGGSTPT